MGRSSAPPAGREAGRCDPAGAHVGVLGRNVRQFVAARERIKALRFSGRKGLLFFGPAGTGKTYTIHYLASQLPEHTTLIMTSEQVVFISEYFRLARFLEPALLIVEDVDLIARARTHMHGPGEEMLLNTLLNEMDGLREDADVMVILTTNRPDASRPGPIDQAIAFPAMKETRELVRLYARSSDVPARPGGRPDRPAHARGQGRLHQEADAACLPVSDRERYHMVLREGSIDRALETLGVCGRLAEREVAGRRDDPARCRSSVLDAHHRACVTDGALVRPSRKRQMLGAARRRGQCPKAARNARSKRRSEEH